jgi:transketolase C-terminal domain/subunit
MANHKVEINDNLMNQELAFHERRLAARISDFEEFFGQMKNKTEFKELSKKLKIFADNMNIEIHLKSKKSTSVSFKPMRTIAKRALLRNKKISYDQEDLPKLDKSKNYNCANIISLAMQIFSKDPKVVSIDADLASTSGLEQGIGYVDMGRALNVGVAEANMMNIGEAFAAMGYNTWVSTFCPFFDWKVMRRIAIGQQERLEVIDTKAGWLNKGHGLDLTFLATAPDFETKTNGATHMGNDYIMIFRNIANLKIVNVSCPNQLIGVMKWIMEGNKGLVYLRIMRSGSAVIYDQDFVFKFGKGYIVKQSQKDNAIIISSGRGVHEAIAAADILKNIGLDITVVDMPSIDEKLLIELYKSEKYIFFIEQNNGFIFSEFKDRLFKNMNHIDTSRIFAMNACDKKGQPQFIHSATYSQLINRFSLSPEKIANTIKKQLL